MLLCKDQSFEEEQRTFLRHSVWYGAKTHVVNVEDKDFRYLFS